MVEFHAIRSDNGMNVLHSNRLTHLLRIILCLLPTYIRRIYACHVRVARSLVRPNIISPVDTGKCASSRLCCNKCVRIKKEMKTKPRKKKSPKSTHQQFKCVLTHFGRVFGAVAATAVA